jgi:hypothetical protein
VVHFTEHDVQGFIRARLEAAGLQFTADPSNYTVDISLWHPWPDEIIPIEPHLFDTFGLHLLDPQKQVGVWFPPRDATFSYGRIFEAFWEEHGIIVGIFDGRGQSVLSGMQLLIDFYTEIFQKHGDPNMDMWEWFDSVHDHPEFGWEVMEVASEALLQELVAERKPKAREALIRRLTARTQAFIDHLQTEGILQPHDIVIPHIEPPPHNEDSD